MESFLTEVAQDLYKTYGDRVGDLKILFPSRRARIFFSDELSCVAQSPVWEPEWVAIDEMMTRASGIEVGDRVRLISELYSVYVEFHPHETFDRFYYWGEILLGDFDMVDKYLIDADMLFRNVADIKELECDLSYLSEQERRIVLFWSSIGDEEDLSEHKRRFLKVWQSLAPIYHKYKKRLSELGFAYPGMVHRRGAERIRSGEYSISKDDTYVVAGFNALSECEKVLFTELKSSATTRFYWDRDNYYSESSKQEAGLFLGDNILKFPSAAQISHDNLSRPKNISVVANSSSALQCKYVANILDEIVARGGVIDKRTAIVLTDESLLMPLLYALPKYVGEVNVTMGYPLRQSLAYSFVERLIELQHHARRNITTGEVSFYHVDVIGLLSHPYLEAGVGRNILRGLEEQIRTERLITVPAARLTQNQLLSRIFRSEKGWSAISSYIVDVVSEIAILPHDSSIDGEQRIEFLSFIAEQILTLHNSIERCGIELSTSIYVSLLRRHLQPLRVPFEGEPLEGLQVMGILETRTLDFDNIIILSMNDDNFPGNRTQQPSYIPYNLRAAYGLPTPEHHDGVYAYYFYRLIQRCENLWMLYCSCADDKSTGEQSRYITQLEYESPFKINRVDVGVDVNLHESTEIIVAKSGRVAEQLARFVGREGDEIVKLSPTALFQYVACPLRFYFRSLANIKVRDELSEEVDAPMFGTILHDAMQYLYEPFVGVTDRDFAKSSTEMVERALVQSIRKNYLKSQECDSDLDLELSGNLMIVKEVVTRYIIGGILRYDAAHSDFTIRGVETPVEHFVTLQSGDRVRLWGICDRVDMMSSGALRVVDYKTGSPHLTFDGVEALFEGDGKQRQSNIFQTLLYSYMLRESGDEVRTITPALYYVRDMNRDDYDPSIEIIETTGGKRQKNRMDSYDNYHQEFEPFLRNILEELMDIKTPFRQCDDVKNTCAYCDYKSICRRE